jgi:hypothetical protein
VALLPQFTFRGSGVNNEALQTLFAAATTLGFVSLIRRGFTWSLGVWTGVALACAYLSKINAVALLVPVVYALVVAEAPTPSAVASRRLWPRLLRLGALVPAALIVLPWTIRNISLYGDPFASTAMRTAMAHIVTDRSLFSMYFLKQFPLRLAGSFIGQFGWTAVPLPIWMYALYTALAGIAAVGLLRAWRAGTLDSRLATALILAVLSTLAVVVYMNLSFTAPQGRYMFPALPALGLLAAVGVAGLPTALAPWGSPVGLGLLLLVLNLYALAGVAAPAYYPAPTRDIAPGVRRLQLEHVSSFAYAPRTQEFVVNGADPWWVTAVDVDATEYGELAIALRSMAEPRSRKGCIYFATESGGMADNLPLCFSWMADGSVQRAVVPLRTHRGWTGRVTHLRVDAFDEAEAPAGGTRIKLEKLELRAGRR